MSPQELASVLAEADRDGITSHVAVRWIRSRRTTSTGGTETVFTLQAVSGRLLAEIRSARPEEEMPLYEGTVCGKDYSFRGPSVWAMLDAADQLRLAGIVVLHPGGFVASE